MFSAVGASVDLTTLRSWAGYRSVDTPLNVRLVEARDRVPRMVYVGVAGHELFGRTAYVAAHEAVAARLAASPVRGTVVRATGFFSAIGQLLSVARLGVLPNVGGGRTRTNPIHDLDLAQVCADAVESGDGELAVGAPEVMERREMLALVGAALSKRVWLAPVPAWAARLGSWCLGAIHPRVGQFGRFLAALSTHHCVAPAHGHRRLEDYLRERAAG